ncbi:cytoplasmic 60S subunit biogenesis factor ZNF622-like [Ptychodera flava]|uniref:cytoplasmic 60S subunit biogenesis factor ZNF622-like n=1 Tax=Ptychodera flava TaxID=63121 RepID=UPI00396A9C67
MSSQYTCISCRVAFASPDLQRAHYKSDWHRYNLKRKVVDMPPVSAENFQQRVLAQRAQTEEATKDTSSQCKICSKHFNSQNAFENHMKSKKHRETESKLAKKIQDDLEKKQAKNTEKGLENEDDEVALKNAMNLAKAGYKVDGTRTDDRNGLQTSGASSGEASGSSKKKMKTNEVVMKEVNEDDEMDSDSDGSWEEVEGDAIPPTDCLFCPHSSSALEINVEHMTRTHSFFIPNIEYLVDLEGFITYLGEKVGEGFVCLWCNERGRAFYSVQAVQDHMKDKGHCKLQYEGDVIYEYADFYDFRSSYPDHKEREAKRAARRAERGASGDDGEDDDMDVDSDDDLEEEKSIEVNEDGELVLPSGAKLGHRDLMRYYKQNLPPTRRAATPGSRSRAIVGRVISQYKALGWTGATGEAAQRTIKDLSIAQKWKSKKAMQLGVKHNKFQPHLRPQVVF